VIGTSVYIISRSAWNRIRLRLRRMREPRYLLGAVVGALYFYFSLFRFNRRGDFQRRRRRDSANPPALAVLMATGTSLSAILLAGVTALTWLSPAPGGGLFELSKAEMQFLLPAPIRRRSVLLHRLLRSQLGLLIAAAIPMFLVPRGTGTTRVRVGLTIWVMLTTLRLLSAGVMLWRPRLNDRDLRTRVLASASLVLTAAPILAIAAVLALEFWREPGAGVLEILGRLNEIARSGLPGVLMLPFATLAAPMFAEDWTSFSTQMAGALLVLVVVGCWVFGSDEAFEAISDAVAERREQLSPLPPNRYRVRSNLFELPSMGRPELIFFWKSATEATRVVDVRTVAGLIVPLLAGLAAASAMGVMPRGISETFGILSIVAIAFATLMGPQVLRPDLRTDLEHLVLLKTWPVSPASVIRGALLWPMSLLTVIVWFLVIVSVGISLAAFPSLSSGWRLAIAIAVMLVAPGLIAAQYVIHNAAALMFPAWVTLGRQRPRGFDAMGQRLILMAGTWFALIVMVLPGAIGGGILWLVFGSIVGPFVLVPSALICVAALLTEAVIATQALGPIYARVDLADIEPGE
jgi:ABC-2 type transport system permease protein